MQVLIAISIMQRLPLQHLPTLQYLDSILQQNVLPHIQFCSLSLPSSFRSPQLHFYLVFVGRFDRRCEFIDSLAGGFIPIFNGQIFRASWRSGIMCLLAVVELVYDAVSIVLSSPPSEDTLVSVIQIDHLLTEAVSFTLLLKVLLAVLVLHFLHLFVQTLQLLTQFPDFFLYAVHLLLLLIRLLGKVGLLNRTILRSVNPTRCVFSLFNDAAELGSAPASDFRLIHNDSLVLNEQYSNSESAGFGDCLLLTLYLLLLLLQSVLLTQPFWQLYLGIFDLFSLFGKGVVIRSKGKNGRFFRLESSNILFIVVGKDFSKFVIDEAIVAFLTLAGLHSFSHPLFKLQMLSISTAIESKLKILLALPKLFRSQSKNLSQFFRHCLLVVVIIVGIIGLEVGGCTVIVKQKFRKVVILKGEFLAC